MMNNHFQTLGVAEEATFDQIQTAYEQRSVQYAGMPDAPERMQKVNRAMEALSNPEAREKLRSELSACREQCRADVQPKNRKKATNDRPKGLAKGVALGVGTLLSTFLMIPRSSRK